MENAPVGREVIMMLAELYMNREREEGKRIGIKKVATSLTSEGLSLEYIYKLTRLTKDYLKKIKSDTP